MPRRSNNQRHNRSNNGRVASTVLHSLFGTDNTSRFANGIYREGQDGGNEGGAQHRSLDMDEVNYVIQLQQMMEQQTQQQQQQQQQEGEEILHAEHAMLIEREATTTNRHHAPQQQSDDGSLATAAAVRDLLKADGMRNRVVCNDLFQLVTRRAKIVPKHNTIHEHGPTNDDNEEHGSQSDDDDDDEICMVCCSSLRAAPSSGFQYNNDSSTSSNPVSVRACAHTFHEECLRMWLRHNAICPVCRTDVLNVPTTTATAAAADTDEEGEEQEEVKSQQGCAVAAAAEGPRKQCHDDAPDGGEIVTEAEEHEDAATSVGGQVHFGQVHFCAKEEEEEEQEEMRHFIRDPLPGSFDSAEGDWGLDRRSLYF